MAVKRKKILFAVSEAVPFIKTGGLADVAGSLPKNLDRRYFDCRVIMPKYTCMKAENLKTLKFLCSFTVHHDGRDIYAGVFTLTKAGIRFYFIDNEEFFGGDKPYGDWYYDISKFCFFEKAALMAIKAVDFRPDIIHCHDWQTGLIPAYVNELKSDPFYSRIKTVFTIHNLKFQGRWGIDHMKWITGLPDSYFTSEGLEYYNDGNMLKGGVVYADAVTTVSRTYAEEIKTPEYGEGLDGLMRKRAWALRGIVNGIDYREFNPESDRLISAFYNSENFSLVKNKNKKALQKALGLSEDDGKLLIGMVTRLTDQKGLDLIGQILETLSGDDIQIAVVGTGDERYEAMFMEAAQRHPGKIAAYIRYSDEMAHKVYAGADAYLMPSRFEPCGLSQLIALRYGTVPIVRETGGLKDTVIPYNRYSGEGTGFSFADYSPECLLSCIRYAEDVFRENKEAWDGLIRSGMNTDFSWKSSALSYQELYDWLIG